MENTIESWHVGTIDRVCTPVMSSDDCVALCYGPNRESNARRIATLPDLLAAAIKAEKLLDAILSFYGQGLEVANWHQNGDTESYDNFIDDNSDGNELQELRAAIAKATEVEKR